MVTTLPADVQFLTEDTSVALASQIQFADVSTSFHITPSLILIVDAIVVFCWGRSTHQTFSKEIKIP